MFRAYKLIEDARGLNKYGYTSLCSLNTLEHLLKIWCMPAKFKHADIATVPSGTWLKTKKVSGHQFFPLKIVMLVPTETKRVGKNVSYIEWI
jgi:hypothetical protein